MSNEERIAKLEALIASQGKELEALKQGIYNFSDKQVWTKGLKVSTLEVDTLTPTNLTVAGTANFTGTLQAGGSPGATTAFSTAATVTATFVKGILVSAV